MARGAVVVILSDGWERADPALVGREMERLARLAHRIVWVNPRAGAPGFEPSTGGMAAALPHCDALVSGHSLNAIDELAAALTATDPSPGELRRSAARRGRAAGLGERRAHRGPAPGADAERLRTEARPHHAVSSAPSHRAVPRSRYSGLRPRSIRRADGR